MRIGSGSQSRDSHGDGHLGCAAGASPRECSGGSPAKAKNRLGRLAGIPQTGKDDKTDFRKPRKQEKPLRRPRGAPDFLKNNPGSLAETPQATK